MYNTASPGCVHQRVRAEPHNSSYAAPAACYIKYIIAMGYYQIVDIISIIVIIVMMMMMIIIIIIIIIGSITTEQWPSFLIQRGTEVPLRRSPVSVRPCGGPWGTPHQLEVRYSWAPVKPPRRQTLRSPRPNVTSVPALSEAELGKRTEAAGRGSPIRTNFRSSGMWCLRIWCLIITHIAKLVVYI